jgi:hypothetical protein
MLFQASAINILRGTIFINFRAINLGLYNITLDMMKTLF